MKEEQEASESKSNVNTKNFSEVRAPSSTSPPSPEGFLTTITSQRCYKYTGVPNSTISSTSNLLIVKRPQTFSCKILFPYKVLREQWIWFEALVCKEKRKGNQRILENTSENEREFQHKNQEKESLLNALNFWNFVNFCCEWTFPQTPLFIVEG